MSDVATAKPPKGAPKIWVEYVDLDELKDAPRNPKEHDIENIKASMRRFGFTVPGGVNERTGTMFAGHGRRDALLQMREAGEPAPTRIFVKEDRWFVPVLRGISFDTDAEAEAYLLADNRLTTLGGDDEQMLARMLADLAKEPAGLLGTGYQEADIAALAAFGDGGTHEDNDGGPQFSPQRQLRVVVLCDTQEQVTKLRRHLGLEGDLDKSSFTFGEITRELED